MNAGQYQRGLGLKMKAPFRLQVFIVVEETVVPRHAPVDSDRPASVLQHAEMDKTSKAWLPCVLLRFYCCEKTQ